MSSVRGVRPPLLDLALAGGLLVAAIVTTAADTRAAEPAAMVGAVLVAGSLALRRIAALGMAVLASAAVLLVPRVDGVLWLLAAVLVIAFSAGLHLATGRAVLALGILLVSATVLQARSASLLAAALVPLVLVGGAGAAGMLLGASRRQSGRLLEITERLGLERAEQHRLAAEAERSRVSRDLHDILAHTLSTIVVQASAASELLGHASGSVQMNAAADAGRAGLTEVRSLLALARSAPPAVSEEVEESDAPDRVNWPLAWLASAGIAGSAACLAVVSRMAPDGLPLWGFGLTLLLAFVGPAALPARAAVGGVAAVLVSAAVFPDDQRTLVGWAVSVAVIVGGPAIAGLLVGRARTRAQRLWRMGERLAAERERSAVLVAAAERARIARELHDVLAHRLSSIAVQAGAAQQLVTAGEPARGPIDVVAMSAPQALSEVRGLLSHEDAHHAPVTPGPSLDRVPELVLADGALLVECGPPAPVGGEVSLAAFRIVQESLTNARRHAPGHRPTVALEWTSDVLRIRIENDGPSTLQSDDGHGLIGMGERVRACGGQLQVGPHPDGAGWMVDASLPLAAVHT